MSHYKTAIEIKHPPSIVFDAITENLASWWGRQDHRIDKAGTVFTVSWGEPWYQFEVTHYIENHEMIWKCIDANQIIGGLEGVQKEWVDTKIHWKLKPLGNDDSLLEFEHEGLVPDFICFQVCSTSWDHFLKESLIAYLDN